MRTFSGGYSCAGIDRPRRHVPSHQYSPAVISPARGYIAVNGSATQRTKNSKNLSVGGPESEPLLFQSIHVSGTTTGCFHSGRPVMRIPQCTKVPRLGHFLMEIKPKS